MFNHHPQRINLLLSMCHDNFKAFIQQNESSLILNLCPFIESGIRVSIHDENK